jgi:NAD+ diphosphatase
MTGRLPPLSRSLFDRVTERRSDLTWLAEAWTRAQVLRVSPTSSTPTGPDGSMLLRPSAEFDAGFEANADRWLLGVHEEVPYFAVLSQADEDWKGPRELAAVQSELLQDLLVTAVALTQWHLRHPRCPLCGSPTEIATAGWTRRCPVDASTHFPRNDPAVIMLVHDGADRCLLGRGAQWGAGRFSTLAGFVDAGESLEAAVEREVLEEVGVRVHDVRYVASQPWPFPNSLMLGFTARAEAASTHADGVEVLEAGWFTRDELRRAADWTDDEVQPEVEGGAVLRAIPPKFSISRYLIDGWLEGRLG